jgi:hypothetical protein
MQLSFNYNFLTQLLIILSRLNSGHTSPMNLAQLVDICIIMQGIGIRIPVMWNFKPLDYLNKKNSGHTSIVWPKPQSMQNCK